MLFERLLIGGGYVNVPPSGLVNMKTWGANDDYQTVQGTDVGDVLLPADPVTAVTVNFIKVSGGWSSPSNGYALGISDDGKLFAWGGNSRYQTGLGINTGNTTDITQVGSATNWIDVSAGFGYALGVTSDGKLWAWGDNAAYQTGVGVNTGFLTTPTQVGVATNWKKCFASAISEMSFAITTANELYSWGNNSSGQTAQGTSSGSTTTPTQVGSMSNWVTVSPSAGYIRYATGVTSDGKAWSWGSNFGYATGRGTNAGNTLTPTQIGSDVDWIDVSAGGTATLFVKANGKMYSCGDNTDGQAGQGASVGPFTTPTQVGSATNWIAVDSTFFHSTSYSLAMTNDGKIYGFGPNTNGATGQNTTSGNTLTPTQIGSATNWFAIAAGPNTNPGSYGLYGANPISSDMKSWGTNNGGQTGQGVSTGNTVVPTLVGSKSNWLMISAGQLSASASNGSPIAAINQDGTLWSWGVNDNFSGTPQGTIGQGISTSFFTNPTQIGSATNWIWVSQSDQGGIGITSDGKAWSWGVDRYGELGAGGGNTVRGTPTQIGSGTDWIKAFVGSQTSFLLKNDNTLWALGRNTFYGTGLGTNVGNTTTPTQVGSATNWSYVSCSNLSALGLRSDGTAWSWGTDNNASLGQGSTGGVYSTPTQIGSDTDWQTISIVAAGNNYFSLFTKTTGTLWSCGSNASFQTAQGTSSGNTTTITQIGSGTDWVDARTGGNSTFGFGLGLRSDGSIYSWGANDNYQTGQGIATGTTNSPTRIGVLNNWSYIAAAYWCAFGLTT